MTYGLTKSQKIVKRVFDVICSLLGLVLFIVPILFFAILSSVKFKTSGFFLQKRIGQYGKPFIIYKLRTLPTKESKNSNKFGVFLRTSKIDELPQLFNVLMSDMSIVGPRPDIPGYADKLKGEDRMILTVKPGITGPASIYFRNEEAILKAQNCPKTYNDSIIWTKKVIINKEYVKKYSFKKDICYVIKTILP